MHSRRARPTLRLLAEDLTADWFSPRPRRLLSEGQFSELHPLSELPHPIIAKAAESFGRSPDADNYVGLIASSTRLRLMEIKAGQWRGGVWLDAQTGVNWLVVAGLAKGGHADREDFYQRIERANDIGGTEAWLPAESDMRLLKQETAARLITQWELAVQHQLLDALRKVHDGGTAQLNVGHPVQEEGRLAVLTISIEPIRDEAYRADEIELEVVGERAYLGSNLIWQLTIRALITLSPPEQTWDRDGDAYSNIAEPGYFTKRVSALELLVADGVLAESESGNHAHYAHRQHLAGNTIEGKAVRALCGVYFVPTQDHQVLPCCSVCQERLAALPPGPRE